MVGGEAAVAEAENRARTRFGDRKPSDDGEPFDAGDGDPVSAGKVVWADDQGVTCRRWNWRQGLRTRLRADSRNAYFLLERLDPLPEETLERAADELCAAIARWPARPTMTRIRLTPRAAGAFHPL